MTPLQIGAHFRLAMRRRARERAENLALYASAFRTKGDDLNKEIRKLLSDANTI